jgi:hypothetical protein
LDRGDIVGERAWEVAYKAKQRVFYEAATETIRTCPENYCLAARDGHHWLAFTDAAAKLTASDVEDVLANHPRLDGVRLADIFAEVYPR